MIVEPVAGQNTVGHLPSDYADVPPVVSSTTKAPVPSITVAPLSRNIKADYCWLESVPKSLALASEDEESSVK